MIGQLTDGQIDTVLHSNVLGRLACCARGKPYLVPLAYVYQKPFLYAHTPEGLKVEIMRQNPEVCFEVDQIDNLANWRSVIINGTYQQLNGDEAEEALRIMKNRLNPIQTSTYSHFLWSMKAKNISIMHKENKEVFFRILINRKSGRFEKSE